MASGMETNSNVQIGKSIEEKIMDLIMFKSRHDKT